nr:retrovirus-related Pol polyprotein from transposon TNT 1-94 [Tanacetum cinerariifolium]
MLDKDQYDSWKSRMELYMKNRENERMIPESVKHGLIIWPTIEENRVTKTKKHAELSATEKIQADCDFKETNIIIQGQQRVVKCFNCQGEGHMARQCPKQKRRRDATWFKDKVLLVDAQEKGKVLNEEELEFLADPGSSYGLSSYGSDVLSKLPHSENTHTDMLNQSVPILYDGNVIAKETNVISIPDSKKTLMLEEESRSKMLLKQSDPMVLEKKVNTKPINYDELNRLSKDFDKRFVPQRELSDEQALHPNTDQSASFPVKIKAPRELPKVTKIQTFCNYIEAAVQQYHVEKQCFEIQNKQFLIENDQLLVQMNSQDITNIVVNSSLDINTYVNVNSFVAMNDSVNYVEMCNKCLELKAELIKQHNIVRKDEYNKLLKLSSELEQHCISLEIALQLNKEIFQKKNIYMNQTKPSFDQLFELNNLKAELQAKDTTIEKLKTNIKRLNKTSITNSVKKDIDEIETINIELKHKAREHVESLVNQLNQKFVETIDLNAQLQEKVFIITTLKNDLRKFKGKDIADDDAQASNATTIAPGMYKLDLGESLHKYCLRFTQMINDMNIYNMKMEQFQVNTKFLNNLPHEWSKFVTDVKLVKDLHTTNFDQLHAYLEQHELHANEIRLLRFPQPIITLEFHRIQETKKLFKMAGSQCNKFRRDKVKVILVLVIRVILLVLGETMQMDMQGLLNATTAKIEDLDTYDSDCDDISNAKVVLTANISNYGSGVISEVPHSETYLNDMENQSKDCA